MAYFHDKARYTTMVSICASAFGDTHGEAVAASHVALKERLLYLMNSCCVEFDDEQMAYQSLLDLYKGLLARSDDYLTQEDWEAVRRVTEALEKLQYSPQEKHDAA